MAQPEFDEADAYRAFERGDYAESARMFERLSVHGSETALIHLAWMHKTGVLGRADLPKAVSLWRKAANEGSAVAKYYLARACMERRELSTARELFVDSALQSYVPSMYWAGSMLVSGEGGPADYEKGVAWLTRAAEEGHAFARRDLLIAQIRRASLSRRLPLYLQLLWNLLRTLPQIVRSPSGDGFR